MSLLEDIFLRDEADEARELERVIEGDDIEDRPRTPDDNSDSNSEKEDEAVEDKRRVDPTQPKATRVVKNPRFVLNPARLTGPRGIHVIPEHFKDFKFKGKGHEKDDLDLVLKKLEHWAYRLYPKFQFEDCLKKIETLGKKRAVMVNLHKIRSNQFQSEEIVVQKDSTDDEAPNPVPEEDEFDKLLQQQIELARATPAPGSARKGFETPSLDKRTPLAMPKATSSPSINNEQRERMLRNRRLAEERRLARLKNATIEANTKQDATKSVDSVIIEENSLNFDRNGDTNDIEAVNKKRINKSNIIDSSDSDEEMTINEPITVDVHNESSQNNQESLNNLGNKQNNVLDNKVVEESIFNTNGSGDIIDKDLVTMRRHNKSNVIESSDSGEDMTINEAIHIDVHKENNRHDINDINEKNNKLNEGSNGNEVVDITEPSDINEKYNKLNEGSNGNEVVDITEPSDINEKYNKLNEGSNGNEVVDITEPLNDTNDGVKETPIINLTETALLVKHNNFEENELIDITLNGDSNKDKLNKNNDNNLSNSDDIVNIEEPADGIVKLNSNTEDIIEIDIEKNNKMQVTQSVKLNNCLDKVNAGDTKEIETNVEDLMDVDFNDEF